MPRNETVALMLGILLAAACDPEPVTGRPPPSPPGSPAVSSSGTPDTGALIHIDAGVEVRVDAGTEVRLDAGANVSLDDASGTRGDGDVLDQMGDPGTDATVDLKADAGSPTSGGRLPVVGDLVIDEILANPTGQDLGREWVEIASRALDPLDLSSLHIADATTDVAVAAGALAPGALLVLGQSADPSKNGGAPVGAAYGTHLILNNDGEQISICLGPCATGLVLHEVSWGSVGADYDGRALVVDTTTRAICPATAPFGTAGDFGTPGQPNPPCSTTDAGSTNAGDD
jgi:hypothetical protein